jgi:hypothetical protein
MGTVPAVSPGTKETEGLSPYLPGISRKNVQENRPLVHKKKLGGTRFRTKFLGGLKS